MGHIYLVRHGETEWNRSGRCMGQMDIPLSPLGIRQAECVAERLAPVPLDALYTSDLARAAQTARIISEKLKIEPVPLLELREIFLGELQGLHNEEVRSRFVGAYSVPSGAEAQAHELEQAGIENRTKLFARAAAIFEKLSRKHREDTIVVVSHGGVIRCLMNYILAKSSNCTDEIFYSLAVDCSNCSITLVRLEGDGVPKLAVINDTSHLAGLVDDSLNRRDFG